MGVERLLILTHRQIDKQYIMYTQYTQYVYVVSVRLRYIDIYIYI